jgi:phosphoserine phosphatase
MMAPFLSCANLSAKADLPLAVGPAISSACFWIPFAMTGSVIVLIAAPGSRAIDDTIADRLRACTSGDLAWMQECEALEAPSLIDDRMLGPIERALRGEANIKALEEAFAVLREAIGDRPIDLNIIPADNRRKRLLLADMDSTMIGQECIDELGNLDGAARAGWTHEGAFRASDRQGFE